MRDAVNEIRAIVPDRLIIHGSPSEIKHDGRAAIDLGASVMRELWSDKGSTNGYDRLALGIGGDGWADDWRYGRATEAQVIEPLVAAVSMAYAMGVRFFVPNMEAAWKDDNGGKDLRSLEEIEALATRVAQAMATVAPEALFALSTYDLPKYHASMRAVIRPFSRLFPLLTGQTYVAETGVPRRGLLPGRIDAFRREIVAAAERGWRTGDTVDGADLYTDCDGFPSCQGHQTDPRDLAKAAIENDHIAIWSAPSIVDQGRREDGRLDAQGVRALMLAAVVRSLGYIGEGAVAAFQAAMGLEPDGKVGPATFRAAGLEMLAY